MEKATLFFMALFILLAAGCKKSNSDNTPPNERVLYEADRFIMGNDLSYLNQILDYGGLYKDSGNIEDPYVIFKKYGCNVARFRLFHTPKWTKEVYDPAGSQMYHDFHDVRAAMQRTKDLGMQACLNFHYSDNWADPGKQVPPAAWQDLTLEELHDSIYNYTHKTLSSLGVSGLMPEYVQVGNEINPGFLLPQGNRWDGNAPNFVYLVNAAIRAVRDASAEAQTPIRIILHVAQPENGYTWFEGLEDLGLLDYDIIGLSYYYMWSSVPLNQLAVYLTNIRNAYGKEVMVMETIYPWTTENADQYPNIIDTGKLPGRYPPSPEGQYQYYLALTQEIIDGGGTGIFLWEPGWITSGMKTQWGQGSAWDCNTLFNFEGHSIKAMDFMTFPYHFRE